MGDSDRARRAKRGELAERAVAEWLKRHGYELLAQNLRLGRLELDLVARQGPLIVVVEVRTRGAGAWTHGLGSMDPRKRQRIRRAGERLWQRQFSQDPTAERLRFDAASVTFVGDEAVVEYVPAAF